MKKIIMAFFSFLLVFTLTSQTSNKKVLSAEELDNISDAAPSLAGAIEKIVVEGFDWGPAVTKVVVSLEDEISVVPVTSLMLNEIKQDFMGEVSSSERAISKTYLSDATGVELKGDATLKSKYLTVELVLHPDNGASPFTFLISQMANIWSNPYKLELTLRSPNEIVGSLNTYQALNVESTPKAIEKNSADAFTKSNYTADGITLSYGSFAPAADNAKNPLIIWLHGAGEGGNDPDIISLGNRVTGLIENEIQGYMKGAYVLTPQSPTMWMDDGSSGYTTDGTSKYTKSLMALIENYVASNPDIDANRIYIGGCSNGGFMTMNMLFHNPTYFAAAFPICEAYADAWITDDMIQSIKNVPIWFTQSLDDEVVPAANNVVPTMERLKQAGAKDVRISMYNNVVDTSGKYFNANGTPYSYNGHFSWVYALNNECAQNGVTIFDWLSKQTNATVDVNQNQKPSTAPGKAPNTGVGDISSNFMLLGSLSLMTMLYFVVKKRKA